MKKSALRNIVLSVILASCVIAVFFIKTVRQSAPTNMKLFLPESSDDSKPQNVKPEAIVNLLLYNDNEVYAYQGVNISGGKIFYENDSSLNTWLQKMKTSWPDTAFFVVIKPGANATYKNTVDALDKMSINNVKRYAMIDISKEEQKFIDSLRKG